MDEDFLKATALPPHTPDACILDNVEGGHLVLDPGPIHYNVPVFCTAYTVERLSLWLDYEKGLALPLKLPHLPRARTAGTLYLMSTDQLIRLDTRKQNGVLYERKRTQVMIHGTLEVLGKPVWMHHAKPEVWGEQALFNLNYYRRNNDGDLQLAHRIPHESRELNGHYSYNGAKVEDYDLPALTPSSDKLAKYCGMKNAQEAHRMRVNKYTGPLRNILPKSWVSVPHRNKITPVRLPG